MAVVTLVAMDSGVCSVATTRAQKRKAAKKQRRKLRRQREAQAAQQLVAQSETASAREGSGSEVEDGLDEEAQREYIAAALRWQAREREIEQQKQQREEEERKRRERESTDTRGGSDAQLVSVRHPQKGERRCSLL